MNRVFPAFKYRRHREGIPSERPPPPELASDTYLYVLDEAEDFIRHQIGQRFRFSPFFFLANLTSRVDCWAAVFFTEIIKNSDEVLAVRAELRPDLGFAAYGDAETGMSNPPIGAMDVRSKASLKKAADRHPVYRAAWDTLAACSEDTNWVAVVDLRNRSSVTPE